MPPSRRAVALLAAASFAISATGGPPAQAAAGQGTGRFPDVSSIRAEQAAVVTSNHQGPLSVARLAVAEFAAGVKRDAATVASDWASEAAARARADAAAARLESDRRLLAAAVYAVSGDQARLQQDRTRLRAIAVGMYTGEATNPQPSSLHQLEAEQTQMIAAAEVEVVAGVVDRNLHADITTDNADTRRRDETARQVGTDQIDEAAETRAAGAAETLTAADQATLGSDRSKLAAAGRRLEAAQAALSAELASVAGPASVPPGQLSILGGAALSASQLAGWYQSQGYVDLTSAPIGQLAAWYVQAGTEEGVRGDVAFAQAVLETGGFSSPDSVQLSNFAGIGHCDTCSAGWAFPSPEGGVLGQVQLLRIFADRGPGPASAPPPVLPSLVPAHQVSAGCCSTVEGLTGVWATDPSYGQQILAIYDQMLAYALANTSQA